MSVKVEVWGDYALFTRPELKVERVSYDVMTPSAARGVMEAIYWHPGMRWVIDKIYVLNPIKFSNIRRNEVTETASADKVRNMMMGGKDDPHIYTSKCIAQRASMVLKDVRYVIEAHVVMTEKASPKDSLEKFEEIISRRLEKGQCYHQPYLGTREFPAYFRQWEGYPPKTAYPDGDRPLGLMLFDMDYTRPDHIRPMFFRAELHRGVLNVYGSEVLR